MALRASLAARRRKGVAFNPNQGAKGVRPVPYRKPRALTPPAAPNKRAGFTPFKYPTTPPPGSYDPALDAQVGASQRGLGDVQADTRQNDQWSLSDLLLSQGDAIRRRGEGLADIMRSRQGIDRNFQQLATRQAEGQANAGVFSGGALAESLAKRTANKTIANQPLDVSQQRLTEGTDRQIGALNKTYQRGVIERGNTLDRATRENTNFGLDVASERFYQARGTGYTPSPPANEFNRHGLTYQVSNKPVAQRTYTLPNGARYNRAAWLKYLRTRRR